MIGVDLWAVLWCGCTSSDQLTGLQLDATNRMPCPRDHGPRQKIRYVKSDAGKIPEEELQSEPESGNVFNAILRNSQQK